MEEFRTIEESMKLLREYVKNENLIKHMLSTMAAMGGLAKKFGEDEHLWKTVGLLHDIDYEQTVNDPKNHGKIGKEILLKEGYPQIVADAVEAHVGMTPRDTMLKKAIYSIDPLTGIIVATALIMPDKKINTVKAKSVKKRLKEKRFAASANREPIYESSEMGLELDEFIDIVLNSMKSISNELGL
ncbi:HDIG domain-containing protein [bacterium]|nr:HDIG domain-containing protein [bacterium]